jgi:hypothetical protein
MDFSRAERQAEDKAKRRTKKRRPAMKVSGRGMKRFAGQPKKPASPAGRR